jgi:hypothetical protein
MRVLHVIPTLVVGGAERMVARLAGHLHRWGHTVSVAVMYDSQGTWIEAELISAGVPLHFLGKRPGLDLSMIPRLARVIAGFRPDVLHTHMYVLKYCLPALVIGGRCRIVHTLHSVAGAEVEFASRILQQFAFRAGVVPVAIGGTRHPERHPPLRLRAAAGRPRADPILPGDPGRRPHVCVHRAVRPGKES